MISHIRQLIRLTLQRGLLSRDGAHGMPTLKRSSFKEALRKVNKNTMSKYVLGIVRDEKGAELYNGIKMS